MFFSKNKNANNPTSGKQTNLSQEKDLKTDNFPIHTMRQDLEEIKNPGKSEAASSQDSETNASPKPDLQANLTETQKSSPFFSQQQETVKKPEKMPVLSQHQAKTGITERTKTVPGSSDKILNFIIASLIILILAAGLYYFWMTRKQKAENVSELPAISEPEKVSTETSPSFSDTKPNYLQIDIANSDASAIKEKMKSYMNQVKESGTDVPIEFVVTDAQNNPVAFSEFAAKSGINLSAELLQNLDKDFSLYIYNNENTPRLGLAIDSQDPANLKNLLLAEENSMIANLKAVLSFSDLAAAEKFDSNTYKEADIRYNNINSPSLSNLSIDYAILNDQLLIGTSKATLRAIIDKLSK